MPDTDVGYFESMYGKDPDPWGFDRRWYERRKYALTVAALPRERFRRGLEAGCANGALTELLAPRCDELHAFDLIEAAVDRATERLGSRAHVHITQGRYPEHWPTGTGDLVVWSEVAYYLAEESAAIALDRLDEWLEPEGSLVAVHYTGATDYPRRGSEIGPWLDGSGFLHRTTHLIDPGFELGVWRRT